MRYTLRIFGIPVAAVDVEVFEEGEDDGAVILGGSSGNFERDCEPLSPTSHHEWEWEDRGGFGFS